MLKLLIAFALGLMAGAFLTGSIVFALAMTGIEEEEDKHGEG